MSSSYPARSVALDAFAGVAAAGFGLGVGELVAAASPRLRSPVLDVGDRVVDLVPAAVKDLAIEWFGTNDKAVLLAGIGVVLTVYAGVLGWLALRRSMAVAASGVALFGVVGALAAVTGRAARPLAAVLPSTLGAVAAALALWWLARRRTDARRGGVRHNAVAAAVAGDDGETLERPSRAVDRRMFLAQVGGVAVGAAVLGGTGRWLRQRFSAVASRAALVLPRPDRPAPPVPAGAQAASAAPLFTPNADFYRIDTALAVPQVPLEGWELRVTGMVDRQLRLDFDDLLRRTVEEHDITLTCVSNTIGGGLVGSARWLGVRLDELLAEAGVDPAADQIVGRSVDGYTCGFPVAALDGRHALVAFGMNGEPLPLEHGFPARLIVPGIYGYASATKWLTEIELTTFADFDHYWVPRGYDALAPIKIQTRIDRPRGLDRIPAGPFVLGGVAWAQPVGIERVQVRIDDGEWTDVEMAAEVNGSMWRQWSYPWDATPGNHTIVARAISRDGAIQPVERSEPLPNGASGHHTVVVIVDG